MALTDKDLKNIQKLLKNFSTKEELNTLAQKIELLPTREEFLTITDKIVGRYKAIKDDHLILNHQVTKHEKRLTKVESRVGLAA